MALNPHIAVASRNAALDAAMNLANGGTLVIYSGTQPANADTALSGNTALATFTLPSPAFAASSSASKALNVPTAVTASATGAATWFRIWQSGGTVAVADGSCGTATADLILTTTAINSGDTVTISSGSYTMAA